MSSPRILLVDDYLDALTMWAFYLRMRGFEVITASDGLSALEMATDLVPDLVIIDLVLPGLGGCDVARRLRAEPVTARVPMIATTGDTRPSKLDEARSVGFTCIMIKPCDPPQLVAEIERALAARHPTGDLRTPDPLSREKRQCS